MNIKQLRFIAFWLFSFWEFSLFTIHAQNGIKKVLELNDSIYNAIKFPTLAHAPKIVHIPIVDYESKTLPVVEVEMGGSLYRFVFDTGSSYSLFNSHFIEQSLNDSIVGFGSMRGSTGTADNFGIVKASDFALGLLKVKELTMLTSYIGGEDCQIQGLIGLSLVRDYDILFDWANNEILLLSPDSTSNYLSRRYDIVESLPVYYYKDPYYIGMECVVKSKRLRLQVDTGAFCTLLNSNFHKKNPIKKLVDKNKSIIITGDLTPAQVTISLGKTKYRDVNVFLGNSVKSQRNHHDGLLGNDILSQQPILLSTKNEQLLLLKYRCN